MEPRPPRPRQQYLPPDAAAGGFQRAAGGPEQGLYAPPPGYSAPPPYPPELELVPRRQRHRQRIARNVLLALLVVTALGVLGWNLRDRFFGDPPTQNLAQVAPTELPDQPVTGPIASPDISAGTAPTQAPVVNNLLATSTPTPAPASEDRTATTGNTDEEEPTATAEAAAGGAEEPEDAQAPADLASLLPDETELPVQGLVESNNGDRTLTEVVANVATDAETQAEVEELLESWGWQGNPFRDFSAPDASQLAPDATTMMFVSIHGFGNQEAAGEALTYFSNVIVASQGYADVQADPIGDENRLLRVVGTDGTTNVVAYIVDGPLLYRIGGSSPAGDPTGDVLQLSNQLINRE